MVAVDVGDPLMLGRQRLALLDTLGRAMAGTGPWVDALDAYLDYCLGARDTLDSYELNEAR